MTDEPWLGDASSLVDAYRRGERSPSEELAATFAAIDRSTLHAFTYLDRERAEAAAARADVALPFGGVPIGVKELTPMAGWPDTDASLVFASRRATTTSHHLQRLLERGGVVPVGQTAASEFGGLNVSVTKLNGVTHNPWRPGRTAGGSSGGSAAAVAGGLVSLATGGDGGGSIRIPAAYNGLVGMKGTFGRITRGPRPYMRPNTVVSGCLARSVRDVARYYDAVAGYDRWDPGSLPAHGRFEAELGSHDLRGLRVAVVPALGGAALGPGMEEHVREQAELLVAETGMVLVDLPVEPPNLAAQWMLGNLATLLAELGDRWPRCAPLMTDEMAIGLMLSQSLYNLHMAAAAEEIRAEANQAMARAFDEVDLIVCATNPGPAFAAEAATSSDQESFIDWATSSSAARVGFRGLLFGTRVAGAVSPKLPSKLVTMVTERFPDLVKMGALTIISNVYGNPAVSIPSGTIDGLPVGIQVLAEHHRDGLLLDVARAVERARPWPLVAPGVAAPS
ncbi:MAG: amidase [Acidimicrobiales bacterium]|nr:amidase [Acidimicrobiales bacterium]MCB1040415.1 amidase [Acidimicrobiales bacterium]